MAAHIICYARVNYHICAVLVFNDKEDEGAKPYGVQAEVLWCRAAQKDHVIVFDAANLFHNGTNDVHRLRWPPGKFSPLSDFSMNVIYAKLPDSGKRRRCDQCPYAA